MVLSTNVSWNGLECEGWQIERIKRSETLFLPLSTHRIIFTERRLIFIGVVAEFIEYLLQLCNEILWQGISLCHMYIYFILGGPKVVHIGAPSSVVFYEL